MKAGILRYFFNFLNILNDLRFKCFLEKHCNISDIGFWEFFMTMLFHQIFQNFSAWFGPFERLKACTVNGINKLTHCIVNKNFSHRWSWFIFPIQIHKWMLQKGLQAFFQTEINHSFEFCLTLNALDYGKSSYKVSSRCICSNHSFSIFLYTS